MSAYPRAHPSIVNKLNQEINAALADPKIKARLVSLGGTVLAGSPPDFGKQIAEDTEKWGKVVKFARIKAGIGESAAAGHSMTSLYANGECSPEPVR